MTAAEEKRRDALDKLKRRAAGSTPGGPTRPIVIDSATPSPDPARVLVPASSSPVHSPAAQGMGRTQIPSSNLGRLVTSPVKKSLGEYSPSSPQPLSRLKRRADPDASPTKAAPASLPASASTSRSTSGTASRSASATASASKPALPRKGPPKLVAAARDQHNADVEARIQKLIGQYPKANRAEVHQAIQRNPNNPEEILDQVREAHERGITTERQAQNSAVVSSKLKTFTYVPTPSPSTPSSSQPASPFVSSASARPRVSTTIESPKKKRRNENSTIYAKRAKGDKPKRDADEESAAESGAESDGSDAWSGEDTRVRKKKRTIEDDDDEIDAEGAALRGFNEDSVETLTGTIACSEEQANKIISLRPYADADEVAAKLRKARGVSFKLFEQYVDIMEGYVQIDSCLNRCESIADEIANTLSVWKGASTASDSVTGTPSNLNDVKVDVAKVSELLLSETNTHKRKILASYIRQQPSLLSDGTVLKDYQLLGVNWLNLLYSRKIGCILADEMGLGKTIQVIAFLAHLKERGIHGPHMIFVPASTLENWTREFERFAPDINVDTYYGSQAERVELRSELKHKFRAGKLEVVLASYTQVTSHDDLSFFKKKIDFKTCVYDEAHMLKNFVSKRYTDLLSIKPQWRLLLTGTPVQNNLQELVSLLMFIHRSVFAEAEPHLRAIFKVQSGGGGAAGAKASMLSQNRVSRARTMLTPFVLRRRKAHVLTLPPKIETTEECEMTPTQAKLYRDTLLRSRKAIASMSEEALEAAADGDVDEDGKPKATKGKKKAASAPKDQSSSNILMELRKAASHPLLFRRIYTMPKLKQIARACLNTPTWCDSNFDYVVEDLEVMTDAEIHNFVKEHEELAHFALDEKEFLEGGKMAALLRIIERCEAEGKRLLLFSQFTMILNILEVALTSKGVKYVRLDGQTRTDERQGIVDEFNEDPSIPVFLLSTKAGGVGINLTAASVVVIFDQDFNPHNDKQAADRAYRIGQERPVEVIKLLSKGSIDEDIAAIGQTKLQLDDMVGGDGVATGAGTPATDASEDKTAAEVKKSLLKTLRTKFEAEGDAAGAEGTPEVEMDEDVVKQNVLVPVLPASSAGGDAARRTCRDHAAGRERPANGSPTEVLYTWHRLHPPSQPLPSQVLTTFEPPMSTYKPISVPLPKGAKVGELWRLGLLAPPAQGPSSIPLERLLADPGVLGVWSEGIELLPAAAPDPKAAKGKGKKGDKGDKGKGKAKEAPKQSRITRSWPTAYGALKVVEQTSFDLDKVSFGRSSTADEQKVWDSGLALSAWLGRYLSTSHPHTLARRVLDLIPGNSILELGSGTGLVSIALSPLAPSARITATDLDSAMEIMQQNIDLNGVDVAAKVLDWDAPMPPWVESDWPSLVL
ncbi:chromosome organization and biogenesis -related protein [Trichosporon asahii var. asahii CBS 2479]|uniref:Chromosome organization and biogenesis-related protein n=1 Tax=Trichosporon asahii var. asahii (strain ATCC 90039 / CBS 2479 / JCM 2466 / KCTC 7840 / NBRC 103889/ NCYC 2677 / UAMH 7654) TaxID=1186058 RepID=J4U7T2_TRIAS|nr:chromosome organization and biogenesis -related protein [Trichosporon asahii var. asahii CBS 2479]EJT46430.1 chromosome organization and biogenesis -related protein [Trichosporon asahii var. asahii CBS 2479]